MTTQVAISNENIEESVAAGQPLSIPCGANHGFVNNRKPERGNALRNHFSRYKGAVFRRTC